MIGGHGGRLDHFLANALLLASPAFAGARVWRRGSATRRCSSFAESASSTANAGDLCTLLPLGGPALGVPTEGLRFPLRGETLEPGSTRGVSNELLSSARARLARSTACCSRSSPTPGKARPVKRADLASSWSSAALDGTARSPRGGATSPPTITLVAHDSFAVSKSVLAAFTKQTGVKVKLLQSGDAGEVLNQAILTKDHPVGDVLFGVDNTFLGRALDAGIFEQYAPAALATGARGVPARPHAPPHADRPWRRVHQLRQAVVREAEDRGADVARRPHEARVPGQARGREPGDVVARASRSCSRPSPATGTTAGATTGRSSGRTT